jgi:hypothetical protein
MKSSNVRETLPKGAWTTLVRRTVLIGGERTRKDSEKSGTRRRLRWRRKGEGEQEKVAGGCALSYEWIGRATGRSATRGVRVKTDHSSLLILTFPPTHLHSTYLLQPLPSHSPTHNASRSRSTPLYRPGRISFSSLLSLRLSLDFSRRSQCRWRTGRREASGTGQASL